MNRDLPLVPPGCNAADIIRPDEIEGADVAVINFYYIDPRTPNSWCKLRCCKSVAANTYRRLSDYGHVRNIILEAFRPSVCKVERFGLKGLDKYFFEKGF